MSRLSAILNRYMGTEVVAPIAVGVKGMTQKMCDAWLFCKCDCRDCNCNCDCECYECYSGND